MPSSVLVGSDTFVINNYSVTNFADGTVAKVNYPDDITKKKMGKNGNCIWAFNASGLAAMVDSVRLLKGSADDQFFQAQLNAYLRDPAGYILMSGSFVKRIGDGLGNIVKETFNFNGGAIKKQPESESNVEGGFEQGVTIWAIEFTNTARSLM